MGIIPQLASEESLQKWFTEAGFHGEAVQFIRDGQWGALWGFCFVEITGSGIPKKALRHLNERTFWGRPLVIQRVSSEVENAGRSELKAWFNPSPA